MSNSKKYNDETKAKIFELRDKGVFYKDIADTLGVSLSGVKRLCQDRYTVTGIDATIIENKNLREENRAYLDKFKRLNRQILAQEKTIERLEKKIADLSKR